jgi:hypothetical protein
VLSRCPRVEGGGAMKRILPEKERKDKVDYEIVYDEDACSGTLTLPSNAKVYKSTFSLKNPTDVDQDDLAMIASIITLCSTQIAQKHQSVRANLSRHRRVFDGTTTITYFIIFIKMVDIEMVDSQQLNDIIDIRPRLITDPIQVKPMVGGGMSMKIIASSTTSPVELESVTITRHHFNRPRRYTFEEDPTHGTAKRTRKS